MKKKNPSVSVADSAVIRLSKDEIGNVNIWFDYEEVKHYVGCIGRDWVRFFAFRMELLPIAEKEGKNRSKSITRVARTTVRNGRKKNEK